MIILGTNSIKDTGFDVANSCRFNGDAYVHKAVSAGNQRTFTYSFWTKRSTLNNYDTFIGYAGTAGGGGGTNRGELIFVGDGDDTLRVGFNPGGSSWSNYTMNTGVFRDPSAWYNIVLKVNTTSGTEAERLKIFVNGVSQGLSGYPGQNFDTGFNVNGNVYHVGRSASGTGNFIKGYLAEAVFIDGTALDADSFGEFDDSGIWKPIDVSGLTAGTNGFYLDFEDSSNLGNDAFGGTDLTEVNLAATDQSTDTCTNNFATLNPLDIPTANKPNTFSQGNLEITNSADENRTSFSSIGVQNGKWYFEAKFLSGEMKQYIGISKQETVDRIGASANSYGFAGENARKWNNNSYGSYGSTASTGDIIMVAFDADNGIIWVGKNGTWFESATQSEIENSTTTNAMYSSITIDDFFMMGFSMEDSNIQVNFGSPMYAISSGNTDGNGYGNFEYAVPANYYSLNSKNLAEYG